MSNLIDKYLQIISNYGESADVLIKNHAGDELLHKLSDYADKLAIVHDDTYNREFEKKYNYEYGGDI